MFLVLFVLDETSWMELQGSKPIIKNQRTRIGPRSIIKGAVVMMIVLPVCKKATAGCKLSHALKILMWGDKSNIGNSFTMSELYFYNVIVLASHTLK